MQYENAPRDPFAPDEATILAPGRAQTPAASHVDADIAAIRELRDRIRHLWTNPTAPSREDLSARLDLLWAAAGRRDTDSRLVREALQQVLINVGTGALATLSEATRRRLGALTGISLPARGPLLSRPSSLTPRRSKRNFPPNVERGAELMHLGTHKPAPESAGDNAAAAGPSASGRATPSEAELGGGPASSEDPDLDGMTDPAPLIALLRTLNEWGGKLSIPRRRPGVVDRLSFADVVAYFTEQHPGDPRIAAGALMFQPHPKGRLVFQIFLDERDRPCLDPSGAPYGRRLVAGSFDDELTRRLHDKQMLIFR